MSGDSKTAEFKGMVADVFITEDSKERGEERVKQHLREAGWEPNELQHWETVVSVSTHDSRLAALFKSAQHDGISTLFSPYQ
ncbi:MAG: hypothetical protein QOE70_664 [Chthoniobacter sp.]|nr:hypothetical protein [Chthoniobacter sp.]